MYSNTNSPLGADTPDAPWNQNDQQPTKVRVLVSITLSKSVEVDVDDYHAETVIDEDGNPTTEYDFSECDINSAVKSQVPLPSGVFKDWCVDDFEIVLD